MTDRWMELVGDLRLTPDARLLALHLLSLGAGEHEVSFRRWRALLNSASRERVREALAVLEEFGLVERHHGGSRADRYELRGEIQPVNRLRGENLPVKEKLTGEKQPLNGDRGAKSNLSKPRARDAVAVDVAAAVPAVVAREENPIDPKADKALDDRFAGCRDSIRDALRYHVDPEFHHAFVMSLLAYIQQVNRLTDAQGATIPADKLPGLIAKTLNELGPEIAGAHNPTRKVTANLHGIARRVNERRAGEKRHAKPGEGARPGLSLTKEELDALPG